MKKDKMIIHEGPILVEPSRLFCRRGDHVCKQFTELAGNNYCSSKIYPLPNKSGEVDAETCPLAMDVLFPRSK